ncbi:MAG: CvpA family protein [Lachnospiraceae bacterium]
MNWLTIIVAIGLFSSAVNGYHKGFIRMAFSLVSLLLTIVLVGFLTPYVGNYIQENTGLPTKIEKICGEKIEAIVSEKTDQEPESEAEIVEKSGIRLPGTLEKQLILTLAEQEKDGKNLYERVAAGVTKIIMGGISFFITLVLVIFVMAILGGVLNLIGRLPILKGFNRFLGIGAGILRGFIILWLLAFLLALFCTNSIGQELIALIEENKYLLFLYEHNAVIALIARVV